MIVIFTFSNQPVLPGFEVVWQDVVFKKLAHFSVFAVLFLTWWWPLRVIERKNQLKLSYKWWLALLICLIFACSDEWHQSFIAGRTSRIYDVGIDFLGSVTACLFVYRVI